MAALLLPISGQYHPRQQMDQAATLRLCLTHPLAQMVLTKQSV
jgi:hypothetical protein